MGDSRPVGVALIRAEHILAGTSTRSGTICFHRAENFGPAVYPSVPNGPAVESATKSNCPRIWRLTSGVHCFHINYKSPMNASSFSTWELSRTRPGAMKLLTSLSVALGAAIAPAWGQTLTVDLIEKMGNNSLFTRWRPSSHFLAPAGWMNVWICSLE